MIRLRAGAATDVGLARANNQDQLLLAFPLFAVADGMGGHAAGEVAAQVAVDAMQVAFESLAASPEAVVEAARAANRAVWNQAQGHAELRGMGTTLTAVALVPTAGGDTVAVVNVGDSRTYRLRHGELEQLTVDHSYVAELLAGGQIDEAEAEVHPQRHVLTRALGIWPDVDVDLLSFPAVPGDRYVLCSDGLSREVTDARVASTLRRLADPGEAARELVTEAKVHGGSDNITVVVVDVIDSDAPAVAGASTPVRGDDEAPPTGAIPTVAPVGAPGPAAPGAAGVADLTAAPGAAGVADLTAAIPVGADLTASHPAATAPVGADLTAAHPVPTAPVGGVLTAAHPGGVPRARLVTGRVVGFFALLVVIVAVAAGGTEYYARSSYFVGVHAGQLTIYQGRPGGVLWWGPTIDRETGVATSDVEAYHVAALQAGVQENTVNDALTYVRSLRTEKEQARPASVVIRSRPTAAAPPARPEAGSLARSASPILQRAPIQVVA